MPDKEDSVESSEAKVIDSDVESSDSPAEEKQRDSIGSADTEENFSEQESEKLRVKLQEYEEVIKRQQAEFDNFRKRTLKEKEDLHRYSGINILKDLINITDNFERALAVEVSKEQKSLLEGFSMINNQFKDLLAKNNVTEIDGVGFDFDPNLHQAIQFDEKEGEKKETVAEVYQKGFCMYDKILRPATVKVLKPSQKKENNNTIEEEIKEP